MNKNKKKIVEEALLRRAVGYEATETVEEYAECDGEVKLVKRKVSKKNIPPDVAAVKMILEQNGVAVADMTDEQLEAEKTRLLKLLSQFKEKN